MQRVLVCMIVCTACLVAAGCSNSEPVNPSASPATMGTNSPDASVASEPSFEAEEGFTLLTLDDFEAFRGEPGTWSGEGAVIRCSGKPRGYLYSKRAYGNFTLRLDYRFAPQTGQNDNPQFPGNTGILVYITGDHKLWPVSLEVQGKYPEMATIKANGGAASVEIADNEQARQSARNPPYEWNSIEIISRDGGLTSYLNGVKICESRAGDLTSGAFGLQSEDFEVHFRNIRIRED